MYQGKLSVDRLVDMGLKMGVARSVRRHTGRSYFYHVVSLSPARKRRTRLERVMVEFRVREMFATILPFAERLQRQNVIKA
jgi:hypothetical protein